MKLEVKISDVYGRVVLQTQNLETIDMSEFKNGMYFATLYSENSPIGTLKFNLIK